METRRSEELIHQIADVTSFSKMKEGKAAAESKMPILITTVSIVYICWKVGDARCVFNFQLKSRVCPKDSLFSLD